MQCVCVCMGACICICVIKRASVCACKCIWEQLQDIDFSLKKCLSEENSRIICLFQKNGNTQTLKQSLKYCFTKFTKWQTGRREINISNDSMWSNHEREKRVNLKQHIWTIISKRKISTYTLLNKFIRPAPNVRFINIIKNYTFNF